MIRNSLRAVFRFMANAPGWRTNRKIVAFDSDDWGSIRMSSIEAFDFLHKKGVDLTSGDALRYNTNDTLASPDDLSGLFDVLNENRDKNNNPCVFTPVCLVANPDFNKIRKSAFKEYFYEPFTETLKKNPGCENSFELWKQGMEAGIFMPQFHGREHLNVRAWMDALQASEKHTLLAFDQGLWGFRRPQDKNAIGYQAAFHLKSIEEAKEHHVILKEGLDLFEKIFGYKAGYFAAPNGFYNKTLEKTLMENGVWLINALQLGKEPLGEGKYKTRFHYLGQKTSHNQFYVTRNCHFEPSIPNHDAVNSCLRQIKIAFFLKKPAIISTHRVNFIGSLSPGNRDHGLRQLKALLKAIKKQWPDVEFISSIKLAQLVAMDKKQ